MKYKVNDYIAFGDKEHPEIARIREVYENTESYWLYYPYMTGNFILHETNILYKVDIKKLEPVIDTYYDICQLLQLADDGKALECICYVAHLEDQIKIETFGKLLNIARALNTHDKKVKPSYTLYYDAKYDSIRVCNPALDNSFVSIAVLFDTKEIAEQAIHIIGEEKLLTLLKP